MKLSDERRQESNFVSNAQSEKWIKHYVESETAVARKRDQEAEAAIILQQKDMTAAERAVATSKKPKSTIEVKWNAF
jgi:hypothetical protein